MTKPEVNLSVSKQQIEASKDSIEEETGIFHWKGIDGRMTPITEMSEEEVKRAITVSETKMNKLHRAIQAKHSQMHAWQYRIDKLHEALEQRYDGVSVEAVKQQKEVTE